jgi:hypothetical protein
MDLYRLSPILEQKENKAKIIDMIERKDEDLPEIVLEGNIGAQP